jgi:hypothetical protein
MQGRGGVWALVFAITAGCGASRPRNVAPAKPTPADGGADGPPSQYVLVPDPKTGGALMGRTRVELAPGGVTVARDAPPVPFHRALRVPGFLGGGFLFSTGRHGGAGPNGLYTSPTFTGPLTPLVSISNFYDAEFGHDFVLIGAGAQRLAFDMRTRHTVPIRPAGLVEIAALGSGLSAGLLADHTLVASTDRGKSWKAAATTGAVSGIAVEADRIQVRIGDKAYWILDEKGVLAPSADRAKNDDDDETDHRRDPDGDDPRVCAAQRGVLVQGGALCADKGVVRTIDPVTGKTLAETRLPSEIGERSSCTAMHAGDQVLLVCRASNGTSVLSWRQGAAVVEKTFWGSASVTASPRGALAVGEPCTRPKEQPRHDKLRDSLVVCARGIDGVWHEYDHRKSAVLPRRKGSSDEIYGRMHWIPRDAGAPIGVVDPLDSAHLLVDAETGKVQPVGTRGSWPSFEQNDVVDSKWALKSDGSLQGWARGGGDNASGGVVLHRDGAVDRANALEPSATFGALGIASTPDGRLWQTTDWGQTWTEVAVPPGLIRGQRASVRGCSEVGCWIPPFVRLGWRADPPLAPTDPALAEWPEGVPEEPRAALPALRCSRVGPERRSQAAAVGKGSVLRTYRVEPAPYGTEHGSRGVRVRAVLVGRGSDEKPAANDSTRPAKSKPSPTQPRKGLRTFDFHYTSPFETSTVRHRETVTLSAQEVSAIGERDMYDNMNIDFASKAGERAHREYLSRLSRTAVPVVSIDPAAQAGLVFPLQGPMLWVRPGASPISVRVERGTEDVLWPASAGAVGPDELALLLLRKDGGARILAATSKDLRVVSEIEPSVLDGQHSCIETLGLHDGGRVAVIAIADCGRPPTKESPAKILVPGDPVRTLAAWNTVMPGNAPECRGEKGAWNAILSLPQTWLQLRDAYVPMEKSGTFIARVRWSEARVCLDAVEIPAGDVEPEDVGGKHTGVAVIARFVPAPASARVAIGDEAQLFEEMQCALDGR